MLELEELLPPPPPPHAERTTAEARVKIRAPKRGLQSVFVVILSSVVRSRVPVDPISLHPSQPGSG